MSLIPCCKYPVDYSLWTGETLNPVSFQVPWDWRDSVLSAPRYPVDWWGSRSFSIQVLGSLEGLNPCSHLCTLWAGTLWTGGAQSFQSRQAHPED